MKCVLRGFESFVPADGVHGEQINTLAGELATPALQQFVEGVHDGRGLPEGTRPLN